MGKRNALTSCIAIFLSTYEGEKTGLVAGVHSGNSVRQSRRARDSRKSLGRGRGTKERTTLSFVLCAWGVLRMISYMDESAAAKQILGVERNSHMSPRNTTTGAVLERMVLPALSHGGYKCQMHVHIGQRLGGGKHIVDVLAEDQDGRTFLISLKWQQVSGTAEQKVPFEAICLADAVMSSQGKYHKAYLVLGGGGWRLRDFFVGGGLRKHLRCSNLVNIVSLESFVAMANQGQL